ncbi:MAG: formate dehydrogenase accessory sulfurtransferase FdhD [Actinobacteria bacterium]|nr:formate dehydrogenase accessory sulfurtransferase FdhD [Actinomycetota bacterium]MBU1943426.1 formate dehydrogenase accessory sulfurtransferase FdhD [Actinomycetota bacterium]MBU2686783.1 formate dehydrogenase accessory sulfurtransferase FdhD [Actinomycetota bacterium]
MNENDPEESPTLDGIRITRFHAGDSYPDGDVVAREEPLEIRVNGQAVVYLMRLPGHDVPLAAGFCLSEGIISGRSDIDLIRHCTEGDGPGEGERVGGLVEMTTAAAIGMDRFASARVIRTGCGGADLSKDVDLAGISVAVDTVFDPEVLLRMPDAMLQGQDVFRRTGGTHGAGVFDTEGRLLVVMEDVGRHNAVDKALGYLLLSGESTADKGLVLSGRLSYEMVLKTARAGIPLICSVSAPTSLGVQVGVATGVTLVGFLRGAGFNVYSHPERVRA